MAAAWPLVAVAALAVALPLARAQPDAHHMGSGMMARGMMGPGMMGNGGMGGGNREEPAGPAAKDQPAGARIFAAQCAACHTLRAGGANSVGPNLHGVFGRKAGSIPGYAYSPALRHAGIVWDARTLNRFIADPAGRVPGTKMAFPGLRDASQRGALIAYLKEAAGS